MQYYALIAGRDIECLTHFIGVPAIDISQCDDEALVASERGDRRCDQGPELSVENACLGVG
jgi:hypothetical protein